MNGQFTKSVVETLGSSAAAYKVAAAAAEMHGQLKLLRLRRQNLKVRTACLVAGDQMAVRTAGIKRENIL